METTYIYTLSDPETKEVRYVGKTSNPESRLRSHMTDVEPSEKTNWVKALKAKGQRPTIEIIDTVPLSDWGFWEGYWIAQLKAWGMSLLNADNGGLGSDRFSLALRRKIAKTLTGVPNPDKWVPYAQYDFQGNFIQTFPSATSAASAFGRAASCICTCAHKGESAFGFQWRKVEGEVCLKIDPLFDENGKRFISDERREFLSKLAIKTFTGKKASPETKAKQRLAKLGKSPANKGVKASDELIEKNRLTCPTRKSVNQYDMNGNLLRSYGSIKEASIATGAARSGILKTAKGVFKHSAGYKWLFVNQLNIQTK